MKRTSFALFVLGSVFTSSISLAHPGSGIVVDRSGNVYFVDTGSGVYKVDRAGTLTKLSVPAYHWMAIDLDGTLSLTRISFAGSRGTTVTRVGHNPTLLLSSDFPVAVGPDGALYYPWAPSGDHVQILRLSPDHQTTVRTLLPTRTSNLGVRWRNGITVSSNGSIYFTEDRAIQMITPDGELKTVVDSVDPAGCGSVAGVEAEVGPYLRGLAVDSAGTIYVAAAGCRTVLKITPDKKVSTVLRASDPWSPTGVALFDTDVYVLEYLHTPGDNRREWLPRVRKVSADGTVTTLATIDRR